MYNFLNINSGDNPNEGRSKINYNFSLISGGAFTGGTSGGTPAGNTYEVQFNNGGFFDASTNFKFNPNNNTLIEGHNNTISGNSSNSAIVGGNQNYTYNSCESTIIGGEYGHVLNNTITSGIFSGIHNIITNNSNTSTIIGGAYNIVNDSIAGSFVGSVSSKIDNSLVTSIIGGFSSTICNSRGSNIIGGIGFNDYYSNIQYGVSGGTLIKESCSSVIIGGGYTKESYSYPYTIRYNYPNRIYCSNSSAIMGGKGNCFNSSNNSSIIGSISTCALNSDKISLINSENVIVSANSKNVTIIGSGTKEIPTAGFPGAITIENSNNILVTNSAPTRVQNLYGDFFAPSTIKNVDGAILNGVFASYIGGYTTGQTVGLDLQLINIANIYNSVNISAKNSQYFNAQNSRDIINFFGDNSCIYNNSGGITNIQTQYSTINSGYGIFTVNSDNSFTKDSNFIGRFGAFNSNVYNSNYSSIINAGSIKTPTIGLAGYNKICDSNGAMIIGGSETRSSLLGGTVFYPNEIHYSDTSSVLFGLRNIISGSTSGVSAFNTIAQGTVNRIYDSLGSLILRGDNNEVKSSFLTALINSQSGYLNNAQCSSIINGLQNEINNTIQSIIIGSTHSCINNYSYNSSIIGGGYNQLTGSSYSSIVGGKSNQLTDNSYNSSIVGGCNNQLTCCSNNSSIVGGCLNELTDNSAFSSIVGGTSNQITNNSGLSSIIGGCNNQLTNHSHYSSIIGGYCNQLTDDSNNSSIIGGCNNQIIGNSNYSSIVAGRDNTLSGSCRSAIFGGQNLSLISENDTILVPKLKVSNSISSLSGGTFYSGITGTYVVGLNTFTVVNGIITNLV